MTYHSSVMVREAIEYLALRPHGVYIDATFGGGGHTSAILQAEPTCKVIACDWDARALELNAQAVECAFPGRVTLLWTNFSRLSEQLRKIKMKHIDGILADFGTSRYQIETSAGLSFMRDTALDMRMSPAHHKTTAYDILHHASERELVHILGTYGEERNAKRIAQEIVAIRERGGPLKTTTDLVSLIEHVVPYREGSVHPATKTFQALRIVVNKELDNINALLAQAPKLLVPGGRLVCISFHSLEDRLVKYAFVANRNVWRILTPRVVIPTPEEVNINAASRSARLRCAERI